MPNIDITYSRLHNQHIAGAPFETAHDVVEWLVASQAQDYFGAKWALGLRMQDATDNDIDRAFAAGEILRTHVLRPTWHFVTPADIRWLLALTAPRVHTVNASMYRKLELDGGTLQRSSAVLVSALEGGHQLTRNELRSELQKAGIAADDGQRLAYIVMYAELEGLICSGARRGKQFTYALLDERAPQARTLEHEEALAELAWRYFVSRGPATVYDLSKWSGLTVTDARAGLAYVQDQLQHEVVNDQEYWFVTSKPSSGASSPTAYLLSIFDEYVSSYRDYSAIRSEETGAKLGARGNALTYIIVVDGQIVGTWKRTISKDAVIISTNLFRSLAKAEEQAVMATAQRYGDFHGLPVNVE